MQDVSKDVIMYNIKKGVNEITKLTILKCGFQF